MAGMRVWEESHDFRFKKPMKSTRDWMYTECFDEQFHFPWTRVAGKPCAWDQESYHWPTSFTRFTESDGFLHSDTPIPASPAALETAIRHGSLTDAPKDQSCKADDMNCMKLVGWKNTVHAMRDHSHMGTLGKTKLFLILTDQLKVLTSFSQTFSVWWRAKAGKVTFCFCRIEFFVHVDKFGERDIQQVAYNHNKKYTKEIFKTP